MNDLMSLIETSKEKKQELVATTVRFPKEIHSFVDGLADQLGLSKQETILKMVEFSITKTKEKLAQKDILEEVNTTGVKFYLLNTNRANDTRDHDIMVSNGQAEAYYDPWKYNIERLKKNDTVFLYENGVGIVAYGKASADKPSIKAKDGNENECYYQKLYDFQILNKPMPAWKIKKVLGREVVFLRTMVRLEDGQKIVDAINKM